MRWLLALVFVSVLVLPARAQDDEGDAEGPTPQEAAELAKIAAQVMAEPVTPSGPPPALQRKLGPVLVAMNRKLAMEPPLKMAELSYWGAADVDGDGTTELMVSFARGKTTGGVVLLRRVEAEHRVVALADCREPVLRVQAIPLAGDRSRHLLVRTGTDDPSGESLRRMALWIPLDRGLKKIWEHRDVDRIAGNADLSEDREATLSDITFQDAKDGVPAILTVAVTEFRAPRGHGAESAEMRGSRTLKYTYDTKRHVLVLAPAADSAADEGDEGEAGEKPAKEPAAKPVEEAAGESEEPAEKPVATPKKAKAKAPVKRAKRPAAKATSEE